MSLDRGTYRSVSLFLGFAFLLCIGGVITLAAVHTPIPDELKALMATLGGGLLSFLVHPQSEGPQPVTVENADSRPLPVQEVAAEAVGIDAAGDPLPATIIRPRATNGRFAPRTTTPEV